MKMNGLMQMKRALNVFKQMDPDMPMSVMLVFLTLATDYEEEVVTRGLVDELGISPSAVNRALTYLSDRHWSRKKDGLHLVQVDMHHEDRRLRVATLTPKGKTLRDTLAGLLS